MKLSDVNPDDVKVESQPALKLSDVHPDDVKIEQPVFKEESWPSLGESIGRGSLQGVTFDEADELIGKVRSRGGNALHGLKQYVPDSIGSYLPNREFDEDREIDKEREKFYRAEQANPRAYNLSKFGTAMGVGALVAPGGIISRSLLAGGMGLADAIGQSESNDPVTLASEGAPGFITGLGTGLFAEGLGGVIHGVGREGLRENADKWSGRAMGKERLTGKKLGPEMSKKVGRYGLDEGIVTPDATADEMLAKNDELGKEGGRLIQGVVEQTDKTGRFPLDPQVLQTQFESLRAKPRGPLNEDINGAIDAMSDQLDRYGPTMTMEQAQDFKRWLSQKSDFRQNTDPKQKIATYNKAYHQTRTAIDKAVDRAGQDLSDPSLVERYLRGKYLYQMSSNSDPMLINKAAREQGNRFITPTDFLTFSGMKDPVKAIPTVIAKKAGDRYGPATAATTLDKMSQVYDSPMGSKVEAVRNFVEKAYSGKYSPLRKGLPNATTQQINSYFVPQYQGIDQQKLAGTKYEAQMNQALAEDPQKAAVLHQILWMNDPEYKRLMAAEAGG